MCWADWAFMMLNKIAYVVVREDLTGPLIRSQVLDILKALSISDPHEISLVWFYRIDYLFGKSKPIGELKRQLRNEGIRLITVPFVSLGFPVSWFLLPLVLPQWLLGLAWVYIAKEKRIFHCRSYNAGLAAAVFKTFVRVKLVFDPRSPYPEELVAAGTWSESSRNFSMWKKIESYVCERADAIIAVSQPFSKSLQGDASNRRVYIIPNNYPDSFLIDTCSALNEGRASSGLVICYVGSFGHWNSPEPYLRFFNYVAQKSGMAVEGLFLVPAKCRQVLDSAIKRLGCDSRLITVVSARQEEVQDYLNGCDIGMQIMAQPDDRLSVKFVEYLASGLPVIVSEFVRGASHIVRQEKVGIVLHHDQSNLDDVMSFMKDVALNREEWRRRCVSLAVSQFSPQRIAGLLADVYRSFDEVD